MRYMALQIIRRLASVGSCASPVRLRHTHNHTAEAAIASTLAYVGKINCLPFAVTIDAHYITCRDGVQALAKSLDMLPLVLCDKLQSDKTMLGLIGGEAALPALMQYVFEMKTNTPPHEAGDRGGNLDALMESLQEDLEFAGSLEADPGEDAEMTADEAAADAEHAEDEDAADDGEAADEEGAEDVEEDAEDAKEAAVDFGDTDGEAAEDVEDAEATDDGEAAKEDGAEGSEGAEAPDDDEAGDDAASTDAGDDAAVEVSLAAAEVSLR